MFIGHFGAGLAAKKFAPKTSLGALITATILIDLLWPLFLLAGLEVVKIAPSDTAFTPLEFVSYPYSHSLLMVTLWGSLLGGAYYAVTKYRAGAIALFALTVSHWVLDFTSHRADMPLYPGGSIKVGLGLWHSIPLTIFIEGSIFVAGCWIYLAVTRARKLSGVVTIWLFYAFLVAGYAANIAGGPPPSEQVLAWAGVTMWIFPLIGCAVDRLREPR